MSKSTQALAAAAIRKKLKAMDIKAKVTSASMMTAVRVKLFDAAPDMMETVRSAVAPYRYGSFNSMEDLYEYSNSNDDLPQVKYITVNNEVSDEFNQKVWSWVCTQDMLMQQNCLQHTKRPAT